MSWDVSLQPKNAPNFGARANVMSKLNAAVPGIEWTEPSSEIPEYMQQAMDLLRAKLPPDMSPDDAMEGLRTSETAGRLDGDGFSMEISLPEHAGLVSDVLLNIRGSESVIDVLRRFVVALNAQARDDGSLEEIDFNADPAAGLRRWQNAVSNVLRRQHGGGDSR